MPTFFRPAYPDLRLSFLLIMCLPGFRRYAPISLAH